MGVCTWLQNLRDAQRVTRTYLGPPFAALPGASLRSDGTVAARRLRFVARFPRPLPLARRLVTRGVRVAELASQPSHQPLAAPTHDAHTQT